MSHKQLNMTVAMTMTYSSNILQKIIHRSYSHYYYLKYSFICILYA